MQVQVDEDGVNGVSWEGLVGDRPLTASDDPVTLQETANGWLFHEYLNTPLSMLVYCNGVLVAHNSIHCHDLAELITVKSLHEESDFGVLVGEMNPNIVEVSSQLNHVICLIDIFAGCASTYTCPSESGTKLHGSNQVVGS